MRAFFAKWFVVWSFSICGSAAAEERFTLSAKLVQPETNGPVRLAIELRNASPQPQQVATLTNLFRGCVYLRNAAGDVHEFILSNYWNMNRTSVWLTWNTPTIELARGSSFCWVHALPQFIDGHRQQIEYIGNSSAISFPNLSAEFKPGCEIWSAFDVHQMKMLDAHRPTHGTTLTVVSDIVRYPK